MGVSPALYPKIVNSVPFQLELLNTLLTIEGLDEKITYIKYYTEVYNPSLLGYLKKYTIGLPRVIINNAKDEKKTDESLNLNGFFKISTENKLLLDQFDDQLSISVNEKEGFVLVSARMPEAKAAAELVSNAQKILQEYIIKFKLQKSKEQLKFVKERYDEKENEFRIIQKKLASFRDRNQKITSALAQTKLEQLQSEHDLTYSVFVELAKQLETKRIKVKEDTPIFTIIDPISIPYERSFPKRGMIMLISMIMGVVVGAIIIGLLTLKQFFKNNHL